MNSKHGKIWGSTAMIFNHYDVEIHRIQGIKGGYSSKHKHEHKYNWFFVELGEVCIEVWKNDYDLIDKTILISEQSTIVRPGEYHRFKILEDCIMLEAYYTEMYSNDIIREDVGGLNG